MARSFLLVFGGVAYLIFLATFIALVGFVAAVPLLPRTVDAGGSIASPLVAVVIDLALIALFAGQHSIMARPGFKAAWTRIVPSPIERSVYVLFASLALIVLMAFWRPIPAIIWSVDQPAARIALWSLFALGWLIVLLSTFLISHFELFGLKQVWTHGQGRIPATPRLLQPFFYKLVRHPLYTGFFIAFWATPVMTAGHLVLALGLSLFMLAAIQLEERDLIGVFGEDYVQYRGRTGMLVPRLARRRT